MHVTLLIPELLWGNPEAAEVFADLAGEPVTAAAALALVRRAPRRLPTEAAEAMLLALAGIDRSRISTAALRLRGERTPPPGLEHAADAPSAADRLLCADPVHLRFHQEHLLLADASRIKLDDEEASALVDALNAHFGDAARFAVAAPGRWYVQLATAPQGAWAPLSSLLGRSVAPAHFAASGTLQHLGHETQMVLHAHPASRAREERGEMFANGVWLWGGAQATAAGLPVAAPATRVVGDGPLARGVAAQLGVPLAVPEQGYAAVAARGPEAAGERLLVCLGTLLEPASYEDAGDYQARWRSLAAVWLRPLLADWRRGAVRRLDIYATGAAYGTLHWRWDDLPAWRRRLDALRQFAVSRRSAPTLATLARTLAEDAA